jgi:outer membrane protein assembly factor BamB
MGENVFLSSTEVDSDTLKALCLNRTTGEVRWQHDVDSGIRRDSRSTFAAPSPVTDGKIVVFFYGNGALAAFDVDGKPIWQRNIQNDYGPFAFLWTFSSTPLLYDGKLYLQVLQRDVPAQRGFRARTADDGSAIESYLLAMDPMSGKTLWKHVRPSKARMESREAFSSPIPFEHHGRKELLIAGGDAISGHNPENGEELWRWGTWNPQRIVHWRLVPSPVAGGGVILACAPKKDPIYAVKAGAEGTLSDDALAWVSDDNQDVASDVPTPAFYDGDFFVLNDLRRRLSRVEPETGKVKWSIETPGRRKYEASPLAADGKLYLVNFDGLVVVVNAKDGEIINTISMAEPSENPVRSTICAAHGNLFIRTNNKLYCIGD